MKCPNCGVVLDFPGAQAGGRKKCKKGFAVTPLSPKARQRAWKTRKKKSCPTNLS